MLNLGEILIFVVKVRNPHFGPLRGPPPQNIQKPNEFQGILGVEWWKLWKIMKMAKFHGIS